MRTKFFSVRMLETRTKERKVLEVNQGTDFFAALNNDCIVEVAIAVAGNGDSPEDATDLFIFARTCSRIAYLLLGIGAALEPWRRLYWPGIKVASYDLNETCVAYRNLFPGVLRAPLYACSGIGTWGEEFTSPRNAAIEAARAMENLHGTSIESITLGICMAEITDSIVVSRQFCISSPGDKQPEEIPGTPAVLIQGCNVHGSSFFRLRLDFPSPMLWPRLKKVVIMLHNGLVAPDCEEEPVEVCLELSTPMTVETVVVKKTTSSGPIMMSKGGEVSPVDSDTLLVFEAKDFSW